MISSLRFVRGNWKSLFCVIAILVTLILLLWISRLQKDIVELENDLNTCQQANDTMGLTVDVSKGDAKISSEYVENLTSIFREAAEQDRVILEMCIDMLDSSCNENNEEGGSKGQTGNIKHSDNKSVRKVTNEVREKGIDFLNSFSD